MGKSTFLFHLNKFGVSESCFEKKKKWKSNSSQKELNTALNGKSATESVIEFLKQTCDTSFPPGTCILQNQKKNFVKS